ncbi:hypothetical protein B0H13DRAFT_122157 [Mycena leptocephala]|nr:hypothetical protein B0H13DRAFT_122157 [Mycena leptocephala]
MFSLLAQLFCCGVRSRTAPLDVQSTVCIGARSVFSELSPSPLIVFGPQVIPNEHSRLLDDPSSLSETRRPEIVVDHQTLSDRLENIVRAKEGRMVSVSARAHSPSMRQNNYPGIQCERQWWRGKCESPAAGAHHDGRALAEHPEPAFIVFGLALVFAPA